MSAIWSDITTHVAEWLGYEHRDPSATLVTGPWAEQIEAQRLEIDRLITANNRSVGIHRDVAGHVAGWPVRGKRS